MFKPVMSMGDRFRYLIFPILHKKQAKTRGSDHWTILVLDMSNGDYMYYNSSLPRNNVSDPYRADAIELVRSIDAW